ncbi:MULTISPECIES: sulfotransferase family protein [unclassified Ruegeria]|uniref:sulfotransferase-like domain-containing protein n=1 Tax=unclassified Ruegeria TaxID=2625375 RepID=UPI001488589C|nr:MULTISPECIES: sulfotransferase family protein [unclassified Ruegeria]NOD64832.1 sulfotransferase family protein [Ruegeria sp. HKCCD6109]
MNKIVLLWSTPRTTSTAFEWMMRMRGDMACFHEPFGEAWYKGDDAAWPRLTADSERVPGLTTQKVHDRMLQAARNKPVFSKDMPHFLAPDISDEFLAPMTHSFLIRDPSKSIPSIFKRGPDWVVAEYGFEEHRKLFDRIAERDGKAPPVIGSDDLLENPEGIVSAWCKAVGLDFVPEALSWEPGARPEVGWYDNGSWHDSLSASSGLKPMPRTYGSVEDQPDHVKEIYAQALPHYEHLFKHRLKADETVNAPA